MKNLKISTKLYMTLVLYSTVFIAVGIYWIVTLGDANKGVRSLVVDKIIPMQQMQHISNAFNKQILPTIETLNDSTINFTMASQVLSSALDSIEINWDDINRNDNFMEYLYDSELELNVNNSIDAISNLVGAIRSNRDSLEIADIIEGLKPLSINIIDQFTNQTTLQVSNAEILKDELNKNFEDTRLKVIIIVLIMLIGPGIMAIVMIIGIGKSIKQIGNALNKISNGDLRIKFYAYGKDELGALMVKLEQTAEKLQEIISGVRLAAINMSHASNELSSVSQDVAQGASEQASTSEEIASSIEEMAGNIQQNSVNASETDSISARASGRVKTVHESANSSLERIVEISEKVSIIGDIAFQTNILSLNAAVEAARAGEHGRGFGVVATEVGKLADRSKNAANEINDLSKLTVNVTEQSQSLLAELIPDIEKTSELVKQITIASQEQNQGAGQINIAIQQLSMVTQQNAASSEEMATSAAEMSAQAKQLMQTMSFFSIDEDNQIDEPVALPEPKSMPVKKNQGGVKIDLMDNDSLDKDFVEF